MKHLLRLFFTILSVSFGYADVPHFLQNRGQIADENGVPVPDVLYYSRLGGLDLYVTTHGLSYVFRQTTQPGPEHDAALHPEGAEPFEPLTNFARTDVDLAGSHILPGNIRVGQPVPGAIYNYYLGFCPSGITGVQGVDGITIDEVYPGISWHIFFTPEGGLKHEFILSSEGDPNSIRLNYRWCDLEVTGNSVVFNNPLGSITEGAIDAWENISHKPVAVSFVSSGTVVGFDLDGQVPVNGMVIDPPLFWSTYYTTSSADYLHTIETDAVGDIYVGGSFDNAAFPTLNPGGGAYFQGTLAGGSDAVIAKFSNAGVRFWSTFIGGNGSEYCGGYGPIIVGVDGSNNPWLVGGTASTNYPCLNPGGGAYFQGALAGGTDAFITKFSSTGVMLYSTYYGGASNEAAASTATAFASFGTHVHIGFRTSSAGLPVVNPGGAYTSAFSGGNMPYMVRMDTSGVVSWSTYIGNAGDSYGMSMDCDNSGNLICALPVSAGGVANVTPVGAYNQAFNGGGDIRMIRFTPAGVINWSTYFGGSGWEGISINVESDPSGNIVIGGYSSSTTMMPVTNPGGGAFYQAGAGGGGDYYIAKFLATGQLYWCSFLGGTGTEHCGMGVTFDISGNMFLYGGTESAAVPLLNDGGYFDNALATIADWYVGKFSAGGVLQWGTFFGTGGHDHMFSGNGQLLATDPGGNLFVVGETGGAGNTTLNPGAGAYFTAAGAGGTEAMIIKFGNTPPLPVYQVTLTYDQGKNALSYQLSGAIEGEIRLEYATDASHWHANNSQAVMATTGIWTAPVGHQFCRAAWTMAGGATIYSNVVEINATASEPLVIYPNPGNLTMFLQGTGAGKIQVWNTDGKLVLDTTGEYFQVGDWPAGMYLVRFADSKGTLRTGHIQVIH